MPYKNPERKRQWERDHREERNERRRRPRTGARIVTHSHTSVPSRTPDYAAILKNRVGTAMHDPKGAGPRSTSEIVARLRTRAPKPPDPAPQDQADYSWLVLLALASAFALMFLAIVSGTALPDPGTAGPGHGSPPQPPSSGL